MWEVLCLSRLQSSLVGRTHPTDTLHVAHGRPGVSVETRSRGGVAGEVAENVVLAQAVPA